MSMTTPIVRRRIHTPQVTGRVTHKVTEHIDDLAGLWAPAGADIILTITPGCIPINCAWRCGPVLTEAGSITVESTDDLTVAKWVHALRDYLTNGGHL